MELRMSLYPGDFLKYIIRWTENIGPIHHLLKKRTPDSRMGDVELAVRFLAFQDDSIQYSGDLKRFLDLTCEEYNNQFSSPAFSAKCESLLKEMNAGIELGISTFGIDKFCRKYQDGKYETRFNRAVFDVLVYSLSRPQIRDWSLQHPGALCATYENLSGGDTSFVRSVETTTKSIEATKYRFSSWLEAINKASGIKLAPPNIA